MSKGYIEHLSGMGHHAGASRSILGRIDATLKENAGIDNFLRDSSRIIKSEEHMELVKQAAHHDVEKMVESAAQAGTPMSAYAIDDMRSMNNAFDNVAGEVFKESIQGQDNLAPIIMNSFGMMQRALMSCSLHKLFKNVTAQRDTFKITERTPFMYDINGVKRRFIDAFATGSDLLDHLRKTVDFEVAGSGTNIDLYGKISAEMATQKTAKFGFNTRLKDFVFTQWTGAGKGTTLLKKGDVSFIGGNLNPNVETGEISVGYRLVDSAQSDVTTDVWITAKFDFANGTLVYLQANNTDAFKSCNVELVISPETHDHVLSVGFDIKHTEVHIPVGDHWEFSLSEEYKDASVKYYQMDAMAQLTEELGVGIEHTRDMDVLAKIEELEDSAIFKTEFNCEPPTGTFNQGKEAWIKQEFHPRVTQVCIIMKDRAKISNCHFRAGGNPMDIRIPSAAGTQYIYKRNQAYGGGTQLDYDFAVSDGQHTVFYLSSDRFPQGKIFIFLIPNSIENNIITTNFYEYATYVSNKYRSPRNKQLPSVWISARYLAKEYFPIVGIIKMKNAAPEPLA